MPTLHPQIVKAIEAMRAAGLRPIESMTPAEARRQMEETARAHKAEPLPVARVEERTMPGPAGPIQLRLFGRMRPALARRCRRSPITTAAVM